MKLSESILITGEGRKYGEIIGNEFIVERCVSRTYHPTIGQLYRSCPCHIHGPDERCWGLTVRVDKTREAKDKGAIFLKLKLIGKDGWETWVTNLNIFMTYCKTNDNEGISQFSMPLHDFVKVEK
jgi:hypothetical protein